MSWKAQISAAATRIAPYVQRTPVMLTEGFGLSYSIEMKLEQLQHTGTFKARGAFNTLLSGPVPQAGIVAASGGNHGAAVAFAAQKLGHSAIWWKSRRSRGLRRTKARPQRTYLCA